MNVFEPRPYQRLIINHVLAHDRCNVWAGMGTGKTVSTLTAIKYLQDMLSPKPALVVAPLRVAQSTWPDEVKKWKHLEAMRVSVVTGTLARRRRALQTQADLYCTNYESLPWLVEELEDWPFGVIVCDESTRLKGFRLRSGTQRAKALASVAFKSERFIELTGTPTANGLLDLWGQAWFLDKGEALGRTMSAYQQSFFYPVRTGGEAYMVKWLPQAGATDAVTERLAPGTVTGRAEDFFDISEPIVNDIAVDLPAPAMQTYRRMEREFIATLSAGEVEAVNAVAKLGKLLQITGGALYLEDGTAEPIHTAKLDALRSVVEEAAGAPILVANQFKFEAKMILDAFPGARALDKDPQTIRDWNDGKIPILVAHPASCGHGLNLQDGGNILVFYSLGYNFEQYSQMCERIGPTRQAQAGHPRSVFIHRLLARNTVDQSVVSALREKKNALDFLLEKMK
jgi:hypothetical protein